MVPGHRHRKVDWYHLFRSRDGTGGMNQPSDVCVPGAVFYTVTRSHWRKSSTFFRKQVIIAMQLSAVWLGLLSWNWSGCETTVETLHDLHADQKMWAIEFVSTEMCTGYLRQSQLKLNRLSNEAKNSGLGQFSEHLPVNFLSVVSVELN